jgi:hypothetical protein
MNGDGRLMFVNRASGDRYLSVVKGTEMKKAFTTGCTIHGNCLLVTSIL